MKAYLNLLNSVLATGRASSDRTGTGVIRTFGEQLRVNLKGGFPLLTTKRMFFKGVKHELLWMLSGSQYIDKLQEAGVHIWDPWAKDDGYVGPLYGYQWRKWPQYGGSEAIDQLQNAIELIKKDPYSRRIVVSAWNPSMLDAMALPPCHAMYQFHPVPETQELSLTLYMRSADCFLGLPFDLASYALLLSIVAKLTNYRPRQLTIQIGDAHIYNNHLPQVYTQVGREPLKLPKLKLDDRIASIDGIKPEWITLTGYDPHPAIKGDISV